MKHVMSSAKPIRRVTMVSEQPAEANSKAPLFAFGYQAVASLTHRSVFTVKRHERAGDLSMKDLASVAYYIRKAL